MGNSKIRSDLFGAAAADWFPAQRAKISPSDPASNLNIHRSDESTAGGENRDVEPCSAHCTLDLLKAARGQNITDIENVYVLHLVGDGDN